MNKTPNSVDTANHVNELISSIRACLRKGSPSVMHMGYDLGSLLQAAVLILEERGEELQRLRKNAWRWGWIPAFTEEFQINYCGLLDAVDGAIAENGEPAGLDERDI